VGLKVFCKKDGLDTFFRCIISVSDLQSLCAGITRVSLAHNANEMLNSVVDLTHDARRATGTAGGRKQSTSAWSTRALTAVSISAFRATWSMQRIMEKEEKRATRVMIKKRYYYY
jgi:hypothetical protein